MNECRLQPKHQKKAETQKGSNGELVKITKSKAASLETKVKINHTLVFYYVQMQKLDSEES